MTAPFNLADADALIALWRDRGLHAGEAELLEIAEGLLSEVQRLTEVAEESKRNSRFWYDDVRALQERLAARVLGEAGPAARPTDTRTTQED